MLTTFELPEVLRFVKELRAKSSGCFDGQYCSHLDQLIACQFDVCRALNEAVGKWKFRIFRGLIECDPHVEAAFREQVERTLEDAQPVIGLAFDREATCFEFARLTELTKQVRILSRHQAKWIRPRRAVRPGYRTALTPDQIAAMRNGMAAVAKARN